MPQPITELLPGVLHWRAIHPNTGVESSSYLITEAGVAIDPIAPEEGLDALPGPITAILLSNRHHLRQARELAAHHGGVPIRASRPGLHEFAPEDGVEPFDFGDTLPGNVLAREIGVICRDETALILQDQRAVVVADGVTNYGGLQFVPDDLLGDDPVGVKTGLLDAYRALAQEVTFDHLLPAHGTPITKNGRQALLDFVSLTNPG
ncbi:MAG TPA: hypothetical protein VN238_18285 [Solirubrobacteraceae bacterium]|nr:hypothetical protein [Solirubrobacteraceae bacterium]